jgi:RNA-dependent RNA polymerase
MMLTRDAISYAIQSNRVIRRYKGSEDSFIRVDFRDEDRLQYRWDREVDGSILRVRNCRRAYTPDRDILLAFPGWPRVEGRIRARRPQVTCRVSFSQLSLIDPSRFEFLAYSSSALREHSVWFVTPFQNNYPEHHGSHIAMINAAEIRETLGDFSGVANQPAKYAARMAQAFTATDPSVKIRREEWEEVPDLGEKPYEHTDGMHSHTLSGRRDELTRLQVSVQSLRSSRMRSGIRCARIRHV